MKSIFHDQVGLPFDEKLQQEIVHFKKETNSEECWKERI